MPDVTVTSYQVILRCVRLLDLLGLLERPICGRGHINALARQQVFDRRTLDIPAYTTLLRRAADTILLACGTFEPIQGSIFQPALYILG